MFAIAAGLAPHSEELFRNHHLERLPDLAARETLHIDLQAHLGISLWSDLAPPGVDLGPGFDRRLSCSPAEASSTPVLAPSSTFFAYRLWCLQR